MSFDQLDVAAYALPPALAAETLTPALVVHLDRVRDNVRRVIELLGGDPERWRPHVKTTKIPRVWAELARAGVRCYKAATTRETAVLCDVLAAEGVEEPDVLLAYPLVGPSLSRLGTIAAAHPRTRLSVLCEDPALVAAIPEQVGIFVDVNPGMNRTGVPLEDRSRLRELVRAAGSRLRGLHFYEGHLHDRDLSTRRDRAHACYDELVRLVRDLRADGAHVAEIITSGTPQFLRAATFRAFVEPEGTPLEGLVHRVSPGTVVFHDARSERENPDLGLAPAAVIHARIVSHPATDLATCDAGSKSIAAEAGDPCAVVLGRPRWTALPPSEEHLPLRVPPAERPARGESVFLIPLHVCPTVNLAEEALLLDRGRLVDVARVSARAHELRG